MKETNVHAPTFHEPKERRRNSKGMATSLLGAWTRQTSNHKPKSLTIVLSILLWAGLAFGGYALAVHTLKQNQAYLDQRISQIEENNQEQIKSIEDQLADVQEELVSVKEGLSAIDEELALTGETIGGTNQTKQALQQRIDQLNQQLIELKGSLKKLEDAARAW